jgi:hypothetical protein
MHAGKRIENRRWDTRYRGPVLIHAAKVCIERDMREAFAWMVDAGVLDISRVPSRDAAVMAYGGIVGRARIVDVIPPATDVFGDCKCEYMPGVDDRWHMHDQYGFVLRDVEHVPFTPCRAYLGLFGADRVLPQETVSALMRAP